MAYQVLLKALKAPADLQYQLAFLSSVSGINTFKPQIDSLTRHLLHRNSVKFTETPP